MTMQPSSMRVVPAPVGKLAFDSYPFSVGGTDAQAAAFKAEGAAVVVGYLGTITPSRVASILNAGLGFWAVTTAGAYDGPACVKRLQALGLPKGYSAFLDLEGLAAFHTDPKALIAEINGFGSAVLGAGYIPGLYVGSPQPLTSDELWHVGVQRYWRGQGRIDDRNNALAEPTGGWCATQAYPSITVDGVLVDSNLIGQDYHGRVPMMVTL